MLILNLKNYPESTGTKLHEVISSIKDAIAVNLQAKEFIKLSPALYDLHFAVKELPEVEIFSQHVDERKSGSTTGWIPVESLLNISITYSVLNHSEHRFLDWSDLESTMNFAQSLGLKLIVCCENLSEAEKLLAFKPYAIAFEDKELIGSGLSITTGRPEDVKEFIKLVKGKTKAIIGAGITTGEDVTQGLEFGAEGFILASAFVKAENKTDKILELVKPFIK